MAQLQTYYPSRQSYGLNLLHSGREDCSPGYFFGPAKRIHYLFHYVISGKGRYSVNGKEYTIHAGEGFLIYPGDMTFYEANEKDPWTYMWIGFDGTDCDGLLSGINISRSNHKFTALSPDATKLALNTIVDKDASDLQSPIIRLSLIYHLFSTMLPLEPLPTTPKLGTLENAIAFIHNNYQYDVRISHIADTVNLERSWLYRLFMDEMGISPKQYLTRYRLKMAKSHLKAGELTLTEVAYSCGFPSVSAFHKHFKKAFGLTPKTFKTEPTQ